MLPLRPAEGVTVHVWMLAEQDAVVPPFAPMHVHAHGPVPVTVDGVPALQRFVVGAEVNVPPLEEPQAPFVTAVLNVAATDMFEFMVTTHCPAPEQGAPDQPENVDPVAAVAESVTATP
jgi:hypothetical protein